MQIRGDGLAGVREALALHLNGHISRNARAASRRGNLGGDRNQRCVPAAAVVLEATVQQQHSLLFRVAYEGVQPLLAERAHAIHLCSVFVSDEQPGLFSDVEHFFWPRGRRESTNFASTQANATSVGCRKGEYRSHRESRPFISHVALDFLDFAGSW